MDSRKKQARELQRKLGISYQAALNRLPTIIHVFQARGTTFGTRCKACRRWLHCGKEAHDGVCACGKPYQVVFGDENWDLVTDGTLVMGYPCVDCGFIHRLTQPHERRNPWHLPDEGGHDQALRCNVCHETRPVLSALGVREASQVVIARDLAGPTAAYFAENAGLRVLIDGTVLELLRLNGAQVGEPSPSEHAASAEE